MASETLKNPKLTLTHAREERAREEYATFKQIILKSFTLGTLSSINVCGNLSLIENRPLNTIVIPKSSGRNQIRERLYGELGIVAHKDTATDLKANKKMAEFLINGMEETYNNSSENTDIRIKNLISSTQEKGYAWSRIKEMITNHWSKYLSAENVQNAEEVLAQQILLYMRDHPEINKSATARQFEMSTTAKLNSILGKYDFREGKAVPK